MLLKVQETVLIDIGNNVNYTFECLYRAKLVYIAPFYMFISFI